MSINPDARVKVYGAAWCGDCVRTRRFLDEHQVLYEWIDVSQDDQAMRFVTQVNRGMRSIPTLLFQDGTTLTEPSNKDLAHKLGLA